MSSFTQTGTAQYNLSVDGKILYIFIPVRFERRGGRKLIIAPDGGTGLVPTKTQRDDTLIQAVARAHKWRKMLDRKEVRTLSEIAAKEKVTLPYITRLFDLAFLAPDIVTAILDGRQPPGVTLQTFRTGVPLAWEEQRQKFGFPAVAV